jgi:ABC-2 type transport system ATP-binding protein
MTTNGTIDREPPDSGAPPVIETRTLAKRYRRHWALTDCSVVVPPGKVVGLVGPNGAGKTTLLHLAVGLLAPSAGTIAVLGGRPGDRPTQLARVGFVAQDTPTYPTLSVADHLRLGAWLNPHWDAALAEQRVECLGLELRRRAAELSGGQRAQLALTLAIAKGPALLVLDEPVASLDPLARREFLDDLADIARQHEVSVVLSSHLVADLERVCDYLIVLVGSRVHVAGDIGSLLGSHHLVVGHGHDRGQLPAEVEVIDARHAEGRSTFVVRSDRPPDLPQGGRWRVEPVSLEDLVLAYMTRAAGAGGRGASNSAVRS